jgi:translation initiation factor 3 subunit G
MAAAVATQQPHKFQWAELEDDLGLLLPPRVVLGPDAGGLRTVIEYRLDDDGNKVKVTTTSRTRSLARARLSRSAVERRSWTKFGDAVKGDDGGSRFTMVSTEEVLLERPRAPGSGRGSSVLPHAFPSP